MRTLEEIQESTSTVRRHEGSYFKDSRGLIFDFLNNVQINAVTHITSYKGAVRGNHYHKETYQWTYVLSGKVRVVSLTADGQRGDAVFETGAFISHAPSHAHAFEAIEDTEWLVFTQGPRAGNDYEKDTFRLVEPLI